jgi:hypothetical protein
MMVECPNGKNHKIVEEDTTDEDFVKWHCASCGINTYTATHKDLKRISMQPTILYDDYPILDMQKDLDDEEAESLLCAEAQRLFYR